MNVTGLILVAAALLGVLSLGHTGRTRRNLGRHQAEQVYADLQYLMNGPLQTAVPLFCTVNLQMSIMQTSMRFYVEEKNVVQEVYLPSQLAENLLKLQNACDKEKPLYWSPQNRYNVMKRDFWPYIELNI
jgi:hypothetical protein